MLNNKVSLISFLLTLSVSAHGQTDTLNHVLHEVSVNAKRTRSILRTDSTGQHISLNDITRMPQLLGSADPLRLAQLMPGIQTNSEFDAGLHIHGSETMHNDVGINGVPIYGAQHLLGIFSIFNAYHFPSMRLVKDPTGASAPNRLGGQLMMEGYRSDTVFDSRLMIGPLQSQGTLAVPLGSKASLRISGRASYINLFYSGLLKTKNNPTAPHYLFADANMQLTLRPNARHSLWLDVYGGGDNASYDYVDFDALMRVRWGSHTAALHHHGMMGENNQWHINNAVYLTRFTNQLLVKQTGYNGDAPSSMLTYGARSTLSHRATTLDMNVQRHRTLLQVPTLWGNINHQPTDIPIQHATELSLGVHHALQLSNHTTITPTIRMSAWLTPSRNYGAIDPQISFQQHLQRNGKLSLTLSQKHQYLHRTGLSELSMPTEFWLLSGNMAKPQRQWGLTFCYEQPLWNGDWRLCTEAYAHRLYHQLGYRSSIFAFLIGRDEIQQNLLHGNGYAYGANVMIEKRRGKLTGWLALSVGRSMRRYDELPADGWCPASHERPAELNTLVMYTPRPRWSLSATFLCASGTPFTPVEAMYYLGGNIVSQYGTYNSARLPAYLRLDIGCTHHFRPTRRGVHHSLHLSVYNATARRNIMFYHTYVTKDYRVKYRSNGMLMLPLPTIAWEMTL